MQQSREQLAENVFSIVSDKIKKLYEIWEECGFADVVDRQKLVGDNVEQLMTEMVNEEEENRRIVVHRIEELLEECGTLRNQLGIDINVLGLEDLPLAVVERQLQLRIKEIRKVKEERLAKYTELIKEELVLSKILGIDLQPEFPNVVPTEEQLCTFTKHLDEKRQEKEYLSNLFHETKTNIIAIMTEMEVVPLTEFEKNVICEEDSKFCLSRDNMARVKELYQSYERKLEVAKLYSEELRDKLSNLWERLLVDYEYRNKFLIANPGYTSKSIDALKVEIQRCEEAKRENIRQFVERIREELTDWWDKCYYSSAQRQRFIPFSSNCFTEDLLDLHELEVSRMKLFYERSIDIIQLMKKHRSLWDKMLDLESREHDPERLFQNRGGQLLREEKERKVIQKELPKIEDELKAHLVIYENREGTAFQYYGECLLDVIQRQWQDYREGKEKEKMARKRGKDQLDTESRMGKTLSCTKRKLVRSNTPLAVPKKVTRIQDCTKIPTAGSSKTGKVVRNILDPMTRPANNLLCRPDIVVTHESEIPMSTSVVSYTAFQNHLEELNQGDTCRSSVAPGRCLRERNIQVKPTAPVVDYYKTPIKPPRKNLFPRPHTEPRPRGTPCNRSTHTSRMNRAHQSPVNKRVPGTAPRLTTPRTKLPFIF